MGTIAPEIPQEVCYTCLLLPSYPFPILFTPPMTSPEAQQRRRSWAKYIPRPASSGGRPSSSGGFMGFMSQEGSQRSGIQFFPTPSTTSAPRPVSRPSTADGSSTSTSPGRTGAFASISSVAFPKRRLSMASLSFTPLQTLNQDAPQTVFNDPQRTNLAQQATSPPTSPPFKSPDMSSRTSSGSFGRMSFSSMMGGLSSLSLSRTSTREDDSSKDARGRSMSKSEKKRFKSVSHTPADGDTSSRSRSRARSQSPFSFRRGRPREPSPAPQPIPLAQSDMDILETSSVRPRKTAFAEDADDSGEETVGEMDPESEDEESTDDDMLDTVTERNTERNALIAPVVGVDGEADVDPDPLGEGVNVVVPPEPYFPSTLNSGGTIRGRKTPRRRKSVKHEPLPYHTSRPIFQRDRCTLRLTQGDPEGTLGDRRRRQYVVASDLSEESRYAVEWGIGTVLRDGDQMLIVTVMENESKVDPPIPNAADRAAKLRSQQERQGLAYILVRQATSLLQRTKLNVTVSCQAWHAKHARHMLLDIVDHNEPTMLIVGSRGLGQLKGILLGSTSHYLIEKCSVPVMVARRRLKRPPRRSAHLSTQRTHVSLAEAGIDRVVPKVDRDVKVMRDEISRDDKRRDGGPGSRNIEGIIEREEGEGEGGEGEGDDDDSAEVSVEGEDNLPDLKVAGKA